MISRTISALDSGVPRGESMTDNYFSSISVERTDAGYQSVGQRSPQALSPSSRSQTSWGLARQSPRREHSQGLDQKEKSFKKLDSPSPQLSSTFSEFSISNKSHRIGQIPSKFPSLAVRSSDVQRKSTEEASDAAIQTIGPRELADILNTHKSDSIVLLDLRPAANFRTSRVRGAINISIPATLLKRAIYTIPKIIETLSSRADQDRLQNWTEKKFLVVYDSDSFHVGQGTPLNQFANKFSRSDWLQTQGSLSVVKGGFAAVARESPAIIDHLSISNPSSGQSAECKDSPFKSDTKSSLRSLQGLNCVLPVKKDVVNPFFNNIRQNQDLIGGVGDPIPLKIPSAARLVEARLPLWLRELVFDSTGPQRIANKFLKIEQEEQARLQRVLNGGLSNTDVKAGDERHSIAAGVERGDKNRYNNIWPYENARVRLQHRSSNACDYVNASHLHAKDSTRFYIATQGPLPGTSRDFWQVVWENDVRVVVMLTKTVEGGQQKCHSYWDDREMTRPFALELLDQSDTQGEDGADSEATFTIRKLSLSDTTSPGDTAREVVHIQFSDWPDFHIIGPDRILALIREVRHAEINVESPIVKRRKSVSSMTTSTRSNRRIICHCSAGCGRTGVFCTIDTVITALQQKLGDGRADDQKIDLIEQTVREFRDQRLSMVQT